MPRKRRVRRQRLTRSERETETLYAVWRIQARGELVTAPRVARQMGLVPDSTHVRATLNTLVMWGVFDKEAIPGRRGVNNYPVYAYTVNLAALRARYPRVWAEFVRRYPDAQESLERRRMNLTE